MDNYQDALPNHCVNTCLCSLPLRCHYTEKLFVHLITVCCVDLMYIYSVKYSDLNPQNITVILKVDVEAALLQQCHAFLVMPIPGTVFLEL